jgi:hypothetical protein
MLTLHRSTALKLSLSKILDKSPNDRSNTTPDKSLTVAF